MTAPRIEVLHVRDPDYSCSTEVWIDGVKVDHVHIEDIDPGRGYTDAEWEESAEEVRNDDRTSPDFKAAALEAYGTSADTQKRFA